eukprot:CAMPEP_0119517262 /NCGR_PEP_ID=MMETSP1344-20130328/34205_1 /TAXON_ID=236787 /ORGANISM="Florenciella parvula, Strain CCMP2471" /LENGTH=209 /DNA_ID=CAMNT_0007554835 /DNA_START=57 /DNA_END=686 /DNA_ORIENTATION=+
MPPPIPKKPVGTPLFGIARPTLVIECFLDLCCPFSKKMFVALTTQVLNAGPDKFGGQVELVFQNVPQPWHAQSSYMHEVALAVSLVNEAAFYPAVSAIFEAQTDFFDDKVMDKTRSQVYSDLIDVVVPALAAAGFAEVTADAIGEKLALTGEGNSGSAVTLPMKWAIKYHRLRSIHVTPTVLVNGIEAPDISSGWTGEQWDEKIAALLA